MNVKNAQNAWIVTPADRRVMREMARRRSQEAQRIGARIADLRARAHLTQEAAAARIHVGYRTYQTWEAGDATPRWHNYERIAEAFGVKVQDILGPPAPSIEGAQLDRIETKLDRLLGLVESGPDH